MKIEKHCWMDDRLHAEWEIWYYPKDIWELRKNGKVIEVYHTLEDALLMILHFNNIDFRIREQGISVQWMKCKYKLTEEEIDSFQKELNRRMFPNGREVFMEEFEKKIEEML